MAGTGATRVPRRGGRGLMAAWAVLLVAVGIPLAIHARADGQSVASVIVDVGDADAGAGAGRPRQDPGDGAADRLQRARQIGRDRDQEFTREVGPRVRAGPHEDHGVLADQCKVRVVGTPAQVGAHLVMAGERHPRQFGVRLIGEEERHLLPVRLVVVHAAEG